MYILLWWSNNLCIPAELGETYRDCRPSNAFFFLVTNQPQGNCLRDRLQLSRSSVISLLQFIKSAWSLISLLRFPRSHRHSVLGFPSIRTFSCPKTSAADTQRVSSTIRCVPTSPYWAPHALVRRPVLTYLLRHFNTQDG